MKPPSMRRDVSPKRAANYKRGGERMSFDQPSKTKSRKKTCGAKSEQWSYTFHNMSSADRMWLVKCHEDPGSNVTYHVFQMEICPTTGRLHGQGYIAFIGTRKRQTTVQRLLGKAHDPLREQDIDAAVTRGSPEENRIYCSKPEKRHPAFLDFHHEFGSLPTKHNKQGPKDEMLKVKQLMEAGEHPFDIARVDEHFGNVARHAKFYKEYYGHVTEKPRQRPKVYVFWGDTGMGKTAATKMFRRSYYVRPGSSGTTWFDGYDPIKHDVVIFNEMCGSKVQLSQLLEMCDDTSMHMSQKGSYVPFMPKIIVFTANQPPKSWYGFDDPTKKLNHPYSALERRLDFVWRYKPGTDAMKEVASLAIPGQELIGIVRCKKGETRVHPCVKRGIYQPFEFNGKQYFAIPSSVELGVRENRDLTEEEYNNLI